MEVWIGLNTTLYSQKHVKAMIENVQIVNSWYSYFLFH
jgi:hypothetical protein